MANFVAFNTTIKNIVSEVEKFDVIEQASILAYLRARRLQKRYNPQSAARQKPLTIAAIDAIKHKARKDGRK